MPKPITLNENQLKLISDICHEYKDCHRGDANCILPVMHLENSLILQTDGAYLPDNTYNIQI